MRSVTLENVSVQAGGRVLHFQRRLNAPPQAVWAALTEPEKVRQWYATISDYPVEGRQMELHFENSNTTVVATVTRSTRPSVLEYTWDSQTPPNSPASLTGSVVRFELIPHEAGTLLTLDHIFTTDTMPIPDILGGWNTHLDELADKLNASGFAAAARPLAADFLARCSNQSKAFARALAVPSVQE
jgi:uncharacterized protein YndB with AHSA1/START domain